MNDTKYAFKGSLWYAMVIILRYFLVSLLPFVNILLSLPNNIAAWSNAAWQSLAILLLVGAFSIAVANSFKLTITVQNKKIIRIEAMRGIIIKAQACYHGDQSCIACREDILTVIGGSVGVRIIPNRKNDKAVFKIRLSGKEIRQLNKLIGSAAKHKDIYNKIGVADVLCHALISSNAIGEIILLMPAVRYIGKIFGQNATDEIYGRVDSLAQQVLYFVPYALATVVFIAVIAWLISFLRIFTESCNMTLTTQNDMDIRQGLIFKRRIHIPNSIMSSKCIGLTPLGFILKRFDVFALLPHIIDNSKGQFVGMYKTKNRAMPNCFKRDKNAYAAKKNMWYKFIMWPLYILAILMAVFLPAYKAYFNHIVVLLPLQMLILYWLAVEIVNYKLCYFKIENGYYKAVCRKGLSIIYVCIPIKQAAIIITQSIFQKRDGSCNIKLILPYKGNIFKIRNLDFEKLSTFSTGFST